jgi:uncharacterized membrane protein YhaH (DUF805 family)
MADLLDLLFSFQGRIGRRAWWIGFLLVLVASIGGTLLLDPQFLLSAPARLPAPADTIWQLAMLIPGTAITVKRFNDRDWPFWLGYGYALFGAALLLAEHVGFLPPEPSATDKVVLLVSLPVLLFVFIDNGFLRGTPGPNRYGPPPLEARGTA